MVTLQVCDFQAEEDLLEGKISNSIFLGERIFLQSQYAISFPLLTSLAEVALTLPILNAWPDKRCFSYMKIFKLKQINSRSDNTLKPGMINGQKVGTKEENVLVKRAVETWLGEKKRRKLPKVLQVIKDTVTQAAAILTKLWNGNLKTFSRRWPCWG